MDKETLHVVFASDDNYAQPLGVAVYSMLHNFKGHDLYIPEVTVLDGGITDTNKEKLLSTGRRFSTVINFIPITNDHFKGFPLVQYFSIVMYYRLLIPKLFGPEVKKVLYLDSDTMTLGNIGELYAHDINAYTLGAVRDNVEAQVLTFDCPLYKDIKKYFNSGVLLMNLTKMREQNFTETIFKLINDYAEVLLYPDQDALNYLTIDSWYELPSIWNTQLDRSSKKLDPSPAIIHYTTSYKPWHGFYHNYYQKYYKAYLKKAWPDYKIKKVPLSTAIKQLFKHIPGSVTLVRSTKKIFGIL